MIKLTKKQRKDIRQLIENNWYYSSGYKWLSGGYAYIKKCKITPRKDYVLAEGWIVSGLDETGHSEKFTDEFDVKLQVTKDTIKILPREK